MKDSSRKLSLLPCLLLITVCALWTAGCGSSGDTGTAYWGGDSGAAAQGYSVSGALRDAMAGTPVQGATCTLLQTKGGNLLKDLLGMPKETTTVSTATTDQSGLYRFTGVTAGTYTISFSKTDYVTSEMGNFAVSADVTNPDSTMLQASQWSQMAGAAHPYDSQKYCITVTAAPASKGTGLSGVTASITPSDGVQIGYLTDSSPAVIDWSATSTYSNGRIFFYNLTPGVTYTITFSIAGYSINPLVLSNAAVAVIYTYQVTSTSPTPSPSASPSPTPSPSSSPTPSPSPSATPTQSGGGGGGGGNPTPTPSITGFTPGGGAKGTSVTIKGLNFGSSAGTHGKVEFNGVQATTGITWGDIQITADVPNGATTGKIKVTTDSLLTATSANTFWITTDTPSKILTGTGCFGFSVSLSDDGLTALIGDYRADSNKGAAYIYEKVNGAWTLKATLTKNGATEGDAFGMYVSLSGDGSTALIGSPFLTVGGKAKQGAAYIFTKDVNGWKDMTETAAFTKSGGAENDYFGYSVSLSDDGSTAFIGAPGVAFSTGAAYIFAKSGGGWESTDTPTATLTKPGGVAGDIIGGSVSMAGDGSKALVGAPGVASSTGAAYIFAKSGADWALTATLTKPGGALNDFFGISVSLSDDGSTALIGASVAPSYIGAAYIFAQSGENWALTATLAKSDVAEEDYFGSSVSISDDGSTALVGAHGATVGLNAMQGAAYIFAKGGGWSDTMTETAALTSSDGVADDHFGLSVSISGDGSTALIGANHAGVGGKAYFY